MMNVVIYPDMVKAQELCILLKDPDKQKWTMIISNKIVRHFYGIGDIKGTNTYFSCTGTNYHKGLNSPTVSSSEIFSPRRKRCT